MRRTPPRTVHLTERDRALLEVAVASNWSQAAIEVLLRPLTPASHSHANELNDVG